MSDSAKYLLALLGIPGLGRVAANRLAESFPDPGDVIACPLEQLALRLKSVPRAGELASEIQKSLNDRMALAAGRIDELARHDVRMMTMLDPAWPGKLGDLDRADRPVLLYTHGALDSLDRTGVALFARPPLSRHAFEVAQTALRHILRAAAVPITAAETNFDIAVHRVCSSPDHDAPSMFILSCGLGKMTKEVRGAASATVRSHGLLLTPFEMEHGPFEHDADERALIQAALGEVSIFIEPAEATPEWKAMEWAIQAGRAVFVVGEEDAPPEAHRIAGEVDLDWLDVAIAICGGGAE